MAHVKIINIGHARLVPRCGNNDDRDDSDDSDEGSDDVEVIEDVDDRDVPVTSSLERMTRLYRRGRIFAPAKPGFVLMSPPWQVDGLFMQPVGTSITWLALAALGWILVVCICRVLQARIDRELGIHERIRESRRMRVEYLEELAKRRFKSVEFED